MKLKKSLTNHLNEIEIYCLAIEKGLVEDGIAYAIYNHRFTAYSKELGPYIERHQKECGDTEVWSSFRRISKSWEERNTDLKDSCK